MTPTTDAERRGSEPAYPSPIAVNASGDVVSTGEHLHPDFHGLTKREAFAMAAMQGYIAAGSTGMPKPSHIAELAVATADALLESLNQEPRT